jgi:hypothetical protein
MNKAVQLPQNEVNAFTFVCRRKVSLFVSLLTVIFRLLFKGKKALYTPIVCHTFKKLFIPEARSDPNHFLFMVFELTVTL